MAYYLVYLTGKRKGERVAIPEGVATVGRSSTADITIDDHKMSRIHCQIELTGDTCSITDLNSTNGTFVNGKRISEHTLQHADHVGVGLSPMRFLKDPPPVELPPLPKMHFCDQCNGSVAGKEIMRGDATWVGEKMLCKDCIGSGAIKRLRRIGREDTKKDGKKDATPPPAASSAPDQPSTTTSKKDEPKGKEIGPYRLREEIGEGELGRVCKAEQTAMHRTVALKVLSKVATEDKEWLKAYLREANLAGQLVHPNILLIYDIGSDKDVYYIAMEYVDGGNLAAVLKKQKSLPVRRSLNVVMQVAQAIEHAFEHKIPHRDVKPANILLDKGGTAKLGGFGTSYLLNHKCPKTVRREDRDVMNYVYCAPEFFRDGEEPDFRSDMYALGASFYHMMTGRPPFEAKDLKDLASKVRAKQPKPPRQIASGFPESFCRIIEKAMAKKPDERYQVPKEMLWDLQQASRMET